MGEKTFTADAHLHPGTPVLARVLTVV